MKFALILALLVGLCLWTQVKAGDLGDIFDGDDDGDLTDVGVQRASRAAGKCNCGKSGKFLYQCKCCVGKKTACLEVYGGWPKTGLTLRLLGIKIFERKIDASVFKKKGFCKKSKNKRTTYCIKFTKIDLSKVTTEGPKACVSVKITTKRRFSRKKKVRNYKLGCFGKKRRG